MNDNDRTILVNCIYVTRPDVEVEEPVFAYIRFLKHGEIGFSVLDHVSAQPDYSSCGVFWVKPKDFLRVFMPCTLTDEFTTDTSGEIHYS